MNVVVMIKGRAAIPVRAIPFANYWEVFSPDALAHALTGKDPSSSSFSNLLAHQVTSDGMQTIPQIWWSNFMLPELNAVSERINQTQASPETGYREWQLASLATLPAGAFIWCDDLQAAFIKKLGQDGETLWIAGPNDANNESLHLDFDPFIPNKDAQNLVLEGFEAFQMNHSPSGLDKSVGDSISEKALTTRERDTLLSIIAVLIHTAKLDYNKPAKTALLIQDFATRMGISIGQRTIEEHLKRIPNAIAGRMK